MMRPLTKLLLISFLLISPGVFAGSADTVRAESLKMNDFFVYKTSRKFVGATVEIISSSGALITRSQLSKRKLVIDFGSVRFGSYVIRVSKGDDTEEFVYIKK